MVQGRLLRMSMVPDAAGTHSRFGIITSRRVGGAVDRNRVRRRIREICRLQRPSVAPGYLIVISAKSSAATAEYDALREEWLLLARRLSILPPSS
jgi:ribonuclease P protein component